MLNVKSDSAVLSRKHAHTLICTHASGRALRGFVSHWNNSHFCFSARIHSYFLLSCPFLPFIHPQRYTSHPTNLGGHHHLQVKRSREVNMSVPFHFFLLLCRFLSLSPKTGHPSPKFNQLIYSSIFMSFGNCHLVINSCAEVWKLETLLTAVFKLFRWKRKKRYLDYFR